MKPNPNEFIIMPKVATDEMISDCRTQSAVNDLHNPWQSADDHQQEMYQTAISAAPPHNLVAVDKGELRELLDAVSFIRSTSGANQDKWFNEFDIRANKIRELLK